MTKLKGRVGALRWILSLTIVAMVLTSLSPLLTTAEVFAEADATQEPTRAWKDISLIYTTDVKGKIEPCG